MKKLIFVLFLILNNLIFWTTISHIYLFFFTLFGFLSVTPFKILILIFWLCFILFWWHILLSFSGLEQIIYIIFFFLK